MKYNTVLVLFFFSCIAPSLGQSPAKIKRMAEDFFEKEKYQKSLAEYYKIKEKYKEDGGLYYNMGVALFYTQQYAASVQALKQHVQLARRPAPKSAYFLARSYHLQDSFLTAAQHYKQYLRNLEADSPQRPVFKRLILQCINGPKIQQINARAIVTGLGQEINSPYDDYRICINSLLPNSILFSSKRPLYADGSGSNIYRADKEQGTFLAARPLQARYNTPLGETLLTFFDNGYQLLLLKELSNGRTQVFKDNFDEDSVEVLLPFAPNLTALSANGEEQQKAWDSEHFFVNDSTVIFASDRAGGFGGTDLYYSTRKGTQWQPAVNLGSQVNSRYDESGLHLYFNSNRAAGMGGHDIYETVYNLAQQRFLPAQNMGVPLNSSADDKDFILGSDGSTGYLSSNRIGSLGGLDLYALYFRTPKKAQLSEGTTSFIAQLEYNKLATQDSSKQTVVPIVANTTAPAPVEHYSLSPIYYEASTGQLNGSRTTLLNLEEALAKYPQLRVVLSAHSNSKGNAATDLYLTVKQAETVAKRLLDNGVNNQQVLLRGCSQNYPIASAKNFDGSINPMAVYNTDQLPENVTIDVVEPNVSAMMQNKAAANYQEKLKGLSYKIKLTESSTIFQHPVLQQHHNITTEKTPVDNYVTYLVGLEKTFVDIKYTYNQLMDKGFSKVEILAYIDGWPITVPEAQVLFKQYPDLEAYLDYRATTN